MSNPDTFDPALLRKYMSRLRTKYKNTLTRTDPKLPRYGDPKRVEKLRAIANRIKTGRNGIRIVNRERVTNRHTK